ncbi:MAG: TetR/AcrR family transcriptional regulator [Eubacteriales bacterium]|nr:TetR/AcrR family transcriptional regulator [Eubacteriales bacterium]
MNNEVTSTEAILAVCRKIIAKEGLPALNMRTVAEGCGVALGSLYHYYPSKKVLVSASVESVWQDIMRPLKDWDIRDSFVDRTERIFTCIQNSASSYPHFFTGHAVDFGESDKPDARRMMFRSQQQLRHALLESLKSDQRVSNQAFNEAFSPESFIDLVLTSLLALLSQGYDNCDALLEMIRRTLYF